MNNLKIGLKLTLGFGIAMICMVFLGITSHTSMGTLNSGQDAMYICGLSLSAISDIDSAVRDIRGEMANLPNEYFKDEIDERIANTTKAIDSVHALMGEYETYLNGNVEDTTNLEQLRKTFDSFVATLVPIQELAKAGDFAGASKLIGDGDYRTTRTEVFNIIAVMLDWNTNQMKKVADEGTSEYNSSTMSLIATIILAMAISIGFALIITLGITTGVGQLQKLAEAISNGDLTIAMNQKLLKRKDEIGKLSHSLNFMKENMHKIISQIVVSSKDLIAMSKVSTQRFNELNGNIQEISAATEELSAGMEETAASSEELNATAVEIDNAVEVVSKRSQEGAKMAGDIAGRAHALKKDFTASKEKADTTFMTIQNSLQASLKDAKGVEQVNSLADAILGIASQTNLLALNAAIEAARAGEAGKGFAVVADEIRNLAENSKGTATQILEIANVVVKSVDLLIGDANKLLEYVEKDVGSDYSSMLEATDDYSGAAQDVDDMTTDLSSVSEELQASIQAVVTTIEEVARAANEGATTTATVADQVGKIALNAESVMQNLDKTMHTATDLEEAVRGFVL